MPKLNPTSKILIVLPFWEGDKRQAMLLARLLADLEPAHSIQADILFCSRFDCSHDLATEQYVSRKFNIFSYTSKRRGTGWPDGCTELLIGAMEFFYHNKFAGKIPDYRAAFIAESDGIPLAADWLPRLVAQWDAKQPACIGGAWLPNGPGSADTGHINGGCCFLSGQAKFLKWLIRQSTPGAGWDFALAPAFKNLGWAPMSGIRSFWRTPVTEEIFSWQQKAGTLWIHGVKDNKGIELARKHLL